MFKGFGIRQLTIFCLCLIVFPVFQACGPGENNNGQGNEQSESRKVFNKFPELSPDSIYANIEKQISFGYRIPGTQAHKNCAAWLQHELLKYCDTVYVQSASTVTSEGVKIPMINLIGSFKPSAVQRMILSSHWDSRPWADNDTARKDQPIDAANDGASGVGILLELAKRLKANPPPVGVDIIFFDAEDMGKSNSENSFCLGSQYWSQHLHKPDYHAQFGVLLDMVGGKDAQFYYENYSWENANWVLTHTWSIADELGYGSQFVPTRIGGIIDDHLYVSRDAGIPMIDIIQYDNNNQSFAYYWHTHNDNLSSIDRSTLKKVGNVMSALVFNPPFDTIIQ